MDSAAENVKLLAIFHWIVAALAGLFAFLPLIYVAMGTAMLRGVFPPPPASRGSPPFEAFGWVFIGIGLLFCVLCLAFAAALGFAARSYSQHRRWTYCLVVAVIACAWFPFGTMLGVFSILTLARPETKALFGEGQPVPLPAEKTSGGRSAFT
jgi:hypothetical protein